MHDQPENFDEYDRPSKTQLKKQMHALQVLGKALTELSKDTLKQFPLDESLLDAILEARNITSHEGKRRQIQYIGRLMRRLDETEVSSLQHALDRVKGVSKAATAQLHWIEQTRERLLEKDDALTQFLKQYPHADIQTGRQLIRAARKEVELNKTPQQFRKLYQWIKEIIENTDPSL